MSTLVLGISKDDCDSFAAFYGFTDWEYATPRSHKRIRGQSFDLVVATDALCANELEFLRLVSLARYTGARLMEIGSGYVEITPAKESEEA